MPRKERSNYVKTYSSREEIEAYDDLEGMLKDFPIPHGEVLGNLGLFLTRASMSRILFMHDLYLKIVHVPGCIMELGCHWGQNLALCATFRTIYEPQNVGRKIVGFDTFEGYTAASDRDGESMKTAAAGNAGSVSAGHEARLNRIMDCHN